MNTPTGIPAAVFDSHTHAFPDHIAPGAMRSLVEGAKWMPVRTYHDGTLSGLLSSMDRCGIRRAIMCSVATRPTQVPKITDFSASVVSERIIPFPSIHPDFPQPEAEVERIASLGLKGLKFHPQYMNCAVDDPRCIRIARAAAGANLAMVIHAGYDLAFDRDDLASPQRIRALHEALPDLRILACHLGGWERWTEALEYIAGQAIYLEPSFCFGQCPNGLLLRIIERHPPQYLLFGSDSPWSDQAGDLEQFLNLPIPHQTKHRALWANAHRFAGIEMPC
jgi:hypothetical protein